MIDHPELPALVRQLVRRHALRLRADLLRAGVDIERLHAAESTRWGMQDMLYYAVVTGDDGAESDPEGAAP